MTIKYLISFLIFLFGALFGWILSRYYPAAAPVNAKQFISIFEAYYTDSATRWDVVKENQTEYVVQATVQFQRYRFSVPKSEICIPQQSDGLIDAIRIKMSSCD